MISNRSTPLRWTLVSVTSHWRRPCGSRPLLFCGSDIRDMLVRVSTEPASRIRELLPDRWKAERDAANREVAAAVRDPPA